MDKAQIQWELKEFIARSHSLDEKKKRTYLAMIRVAPEARLAQLHEIFSKENTAIIAAEKTQLEEQIRVTKICDEKLKVFFPQEAGPIFKKAEESEKKGEEQKSEDLLKSI